MKWYTHAAVGANVVWVSLAFTPVALTTPLLLVLGGFAALLPDMDSDKAKIHFMWQGFFAPFHKIAKHREGFHSLLAVTICAVIGVGFDLIIPGAGIAFAGGYFSHCLIDGFNKTGVGYLAPFYSERYHLSPYRHRTLVGGTFDHLIFFAALIGVIIFFLIYQGWISALTAQINFESPQQY